MIALKEAQNHVDEQVLYITWSPVSHLPQLYVGLLSATAVDKDGKIIFKLKKLSDKGKRGRTFDVAPADCFFDSLPADKYRIELIGNLIAKAARRLDSIRKKVEKKKGSTPFYS